MAIFSPPVLTRRALGGLCAASAIGGLVRSARAKDAPPSVNVSGAFPKLQFDMTLASTGKSVTGADFHGHPVILYFGFTRCPDTCPLTMHNAAELVKSMGKLGTKMRVLFVTVDIEHDTLPLLKAYMANFGAPPVFDGLRGTAAQTAAFAKRYGVGYSAPASPDAPDPVSAISHTDAIYAFGPDGAARYIIGSLADARPDLPAIAGIMRPLARRAA
jgi:protein SCO1/2